MVSVMLAALFMTSASYAGTVGGGSMGGGGGRVSSPSSSSSRPASSSPSSGGSKSYSSGSSSSAPKAGSGGVRPSSFSRPSSGPKANPPTARLVPHAIPPGVRVPRGANFARDTARVGRNSRYMDPYDQMYYGNPSSPYFYLYLASLQDNDPANPIPYQEARCKPKKKGVSVGVAILIFFGAALIGGGAGFLAGRAYSA